VPIGAFVDREQRDELVRLARERDCSMSRIVRRAIAAELERSEDPGVPASIRPGPAARVEHSDQARQANSAQRTGQEGER
jgi:hypothetical protein